MNVSRRSEEGVTILDLAGKLTIGDGDVSLRNHVEEELSRGAKKILINLGDIKSMDSSGLGELVRTKATAAHEGATIKLLHVEDKVRKILEMTRLIGVFDTFNDEIDAIASFRT